MSFMKGEYVDRGSIGVEPSLADGEPEHDSTRVQY